MAPGHQNTHKNERFKQLKIIILPKSINAYLEHKVFNKLCENCEVYIGMHRIHRSHVASIFFIDFFNFHKSMI